MYKDPNISGLAYKTIIATSSIKDSSRVVCLPSSVKLECYHLSISKVLCQQLRPRKIDNHPGTSGSGYSCGYLGSTPRVSMRHSKYRYSFRWSLNPRPLPWWISPRHLFLLFRPNRSVISTFTSDLTDISFQFVSLHIHTHIHNGCWTYWFHRQALGPWVSA